MLPLLALAAVPLTVSAASGAPPLAASAASGAPPLTASAASGAPPRAELSEFLCHRGLMAIDRVISVRAVMRPVSGTERMEIRFQLLVSTPRRGAVTVPGGDLGMWLSPTDPSTLGQSPNDVWTISHPVAQLRAPGTYHFRVSFRWLGANARILSSETRSGPTCFEPDLRPDLSVSKITISGTQYVAVIRNSGATPAIGPFQVTLSQHGTPVAAPVTIRRLGAHKSQTATFTGPPCTPGSAPTVTVDPTHVVADLNTANNSLQASCPAPAGAPAPLHSTQR